MKDKNHYEFETQQLYEKFIALDNLINKLVFIRAHFYEEFYRQFYSTPEGKAAKKTRRRA